MEHEFTFSFDEAFLGDALRRDLVWRGVYASLALLAVLAVLWLWMGHLDLSVLLIVGGGLLLLWVLLYRTWRSAARRVDQLWVKQSPDRTITYRLDHEGFEVVVGSATARHAWEGLRRLWRYSDVWLIEIVKNMSVFFPPDQAPEEARAYILERCRAHGVRTS